ncbi:MAG: hypothetical protein AB1679_17175 [Actinomycetota bacterium]
MISSLLSGLAAKLSAAGLAAKASVGLTMAAASVTGGAAAGVLPEPVQHAVAGVANAVTPFHFPDQAADPADFGDRVSDDARDDEPGVDGSVIADETRQLGEERRAEAGAPDEPGAEGLDRARQTPAADHLPATLPAGRSTVDQYRPVEPPSGIPAQVPAGRPENVPSGEPDGTPSQPQNVPSGQPDDTPSQPDDVPSGQPEEVPTGQPQTAPAAPPVETPSGQPSGTPRGRP